MKIKLREKHVMIAAFAIVLAMLLFPPWQAEVPNTNIAMNLGYYFVGSAPQYGDIATVRLLIQIAVVVLIAFGIIKFLKQPMR